MQLQCNAMTGKPYEGNNQGALLSQAKKNEFKSNEWVTFLQAKEMKLKIKKGSKGTTIFKGFGTFAEKDKDGKIKIKSMPMGFANVFNLDQTEEAITK